MTLTFPNIAQFSFLIRTVAALEADTRLGYSSAPFIVAPGDVVLVLATGQGFTVVASDAAHDVVTAGGVRLDETSPAAVPPPPTQDQSHWDAGTGTTESLITAAKLQAKLADFTTDFAVQVSDTDKATLDVLTVTASDAAAIGIVSGTGLIGDLNVIGSYTPTTRSDPPGGMVTAGTMTIVNLTGTVRFKARQEAVVGTSNIEIRKNGSTVSNWSTTGTATRSIDVAVVPTDMVEWRVTATFGGTSTIDQFEISASDAWTRLGLPIKRSDL